MTTPRPQPEPDPHPMRECALCHESKPLEQFTILTRGILGRSSYCKACDSLRVQRVRLRQRAAKLSTPQLLRNIRAKENLLQVYRRELARRKRAALPGGER